MSTVLGGNNGKWQPGVLIVGYEKYSHHKQERGINVFLRIKPHASTLSHPYIPTARWDENPSMMWCTSFWADAVSIHFCGLYRGSPAHSPPKPPPPMRLALPSSIGRVFQNAKWKLAKYLSKVLCLQFWAGTRKVTTWGFDCGVWKISTSQAREG